MRSQTSHGIVQLGLGGVGQALAGQYLSLIQRDPAGYASLKYVALADSSGLLYRAEGLTREQLAQALDTKKQGASLQKLAGEHGETAHFVSAPEGSLPPLAGVLAACTEVGTRPIVVDVTAERKAYSTLLEARQAGAHIVMCNKWALAEPIERYDALLTGGSGKIRYETTVGASLPVIGVLDQLLETGDDVTGIQAAISGTLGFICSQIQHGTPFSEALARAQQMGYTEPDPRDDLAGIDARRKALILARKLGQRINMGDIQVESLVPPGLESVSLGEFWERLPQVDARYSGWVEDAAGRGNVLRFLADINKESASVALVETPLSSMAGSLNGTESLFVFTTRRYGDQPLAVRGRGAGADITASGVLADILSLAK